MSDPVPRLRLVPGLRLRQDAGGFALETAVAFHAGGPHTLAIVDAFLKPRSVAEALAALQARIRGRQDWIDLSAEILRLREAGLLLAEDAGDPPPQLENAFSSVPVHIRMLRDRARTQAYLRAIRASVRPGDVVVDLGTGSGVLAVAAAQAGATRVYAIEASTMAAVARELAAVNGVGDRVRVVEGWSTTIDLPERADVLVSEIIGNDPTDERILECTADAVRRLLKPGARLLPQRLQVLAAPLQLSPALRGRVRVGSARLRSWHADYGIDFAPLAAFARSRDARLLLSASELAHSHALAASATLCEHALHATAHLPRDQECAFDIVRDGRLDAIVLGFRAELLDGLEVASDPCSPRADNHWRHPVRVLARPLKVCAGQRLRLRVPAAAPGRVQVERLT
ncbi:MAG: 50S ribosomal protein L11 methyltransferase [Xanthomonadales bacterium]|nr:Ribosomal protein L11 methyltransferase [Xanthomonadales bacterium]MCC6593774.1 50S ribosomal protein L11 methyltransferase [Xanthomonadales bacterium]MCE7932695.1 methyltransferase domain-containing protein [Xanthomonadales bacterium PRO6]